MSLLGELVGLPSRIWGKPGYCTPYGGTVVDYSNYGFISSYTGICTYLNVVGPYRLQQESRQAGSSSKYHVCKDEFKDP